VASELVNSPRSAPLRSRLFHNLLERQLRRFGLVFETVPVPWRELLVAVDEVYHEADATRAMLERSIELSSQEMLALNTRMRAVLDALPDAALRVRRDGTILDCQAGSSPAFPFSLEALLGRQVQDLGGPEVHADLLAAVQAAAEQKESRSVEFHFGGPGGPHVVEARVAPIRDQDELLVVIRVITERKEAERRLERSLSLLRATLESTADGLLVVDRGGHVVDFNTKFVEMWRLPRDVVGSREHARLLDFIGDQLIDAASFAARVEDLDTQPHAPSWDLVHLRDGRIVERSSQAQLVAGVPVGRVWSFRDITERLRAEARIREQAALLDKAQDAIMVLGLDYRVLYWNQSATRLYGHTVTEALGQRVTELLHAGRADAVAPAREAAMRTGEWQGELRQTSRPGREVVVASRWTLVRDVDGTPKSILVIDTDVTERKQLEAQYLRAQRVESLGTLAAGIAHDLNNVLTPILGSVSLLRMDLTPEEREEVLSTIEFSATRGAGVVRQVLSFAKGREGEPVTMSLGPLLREVAKMVRDTFPRSIAVKTQVEEDLSSVVADGTQVYQVLMNLCVNARDAMESGGLLSVSARNVELDELFTRMHEGARPGRHVAVAVADTGEGIPADKLERIFEPFFTTKPLGRGTGLGLSTALGIVKAHGGFMTVQSSPGQGATFTIYMRAVDGSGAAAASPVAAAARGRGELVLVVDDEPAVRDTTAATLRRHGYDVVTAGDGTEAVAAFAERRAEVRMVLTDMMMPYMDGAATIRALQRMDPGVRVLVMSGLMEAASGDSIPHAERVARIEKPFTSAQLLSAIRTVLDAPR
jgi:PAS domain S-box-containing protein